MGSFSIEKRKKTRRRFGQPGGRHSKVHRMEHKRAVIKQEEKIKLYASDKKQYVPYQIVKKQQIIGGKLQTNIVVRRIPLLRNKNSKLLQLGQTLLKFKVECSRRLTGYRIINLDNLKDFVTTVTVHSCLCKDAMKVAGNGKNPIVLHSEIKRTGLFSVFRAECQGCREQFSFDSCPKQPDGHFDINVRAVWGTVASGCGSSDLNEMLTTMNIPPMAERKFTQLEQEIGEWWYKTLKSEMCKAAAEEKRIAIEKASYHEGIPCISVICDGGWSKRTHKHTYNASGGVAVIFGAETQKLLYIGVRNKFCSLCRRYDNLGKTAPVHKCHKNWKDSSQAMEADIILEGFLKAESDYGLRYTKLIADGDSSVYPTLQENVPVWGKDIQKLECANHTCKCLRANLEKLVCEKPQYKGKGKLTKLNRVRLTTALRCAIRMRSKTNDAKQLRKDILNSIYHVLGFHSRCSDFCSKNTKSHNVSSTLDTSKDDEDIDLLTFDTIFQEQQEYWKNPSENELEQCRTAIKNQVPLSDLKDLIQDVQFYLNRIADRCHRLIGNFTSNLAESWMAIRAKFDGGKVINRCSRGSWETRCYGGALRKNLGSAWSPLSFQTITSTQAGIFFQQGAKRQSQKLISAKKYQSKPESKILRRKRKYQSTNQSATKKARKSYGSNLDDSNDIDSQYLKKLCEDFMSTNFQKNQNELTNIQLNTKDQSKCELWKRERRIRLTSSSFGNVILRKNSNTSTALIKNMLYSTFKGNIYTIRGLTEENNTIIEYKNIKGNVQVEKSGLKVCPEFQFLAASTDGIVVEREGEQINRGLLEIKNFLQNNSILIQDACTKIPNFCLEKRSNQLHLKTHHAIYYQIQGQLNIYNLPWCDFVLRRTNPYDIFIERVYRDKDLWTNMMLPKLERFYQKFVLPELAYPRHGTYQGIRKPASPWFTPNISKTTDQPGRSKCTPTPTSKQNRSSSPIPSTSKEKSDPKNISFSRTRRTKCLKFLGREILHEWIVNEENNETKWYHGIVTDVIKGKDGKADAVYNIFYKEDNNTYEVDNLQNDYLKGSVKFKDL